MTIPVPLDVAAIARETGGLVVGSSLRYLAEVDSTNEQAKRLMAADWQNGTAILTDFQRAGKGRQERPWAAPRGTAPSSTRRVRSPRSRSACAQLAWGRFPTAC